MEDFQQKAKEAVVKANRIQQLEEGIPEENLYVVWFAKTLQNWKALVSTDMYRGLYWEVTHNGDKAETYVDLYKKHGNVALPDVTLGSSQTLPGFPPGQ